MTGATLADPSPGPARTRFVALDGLRGVASLSVLLFHIGWPNHVSHGQFVRNGYLAVDLFFMLSGFVIYANYAARLGEGASIGRFLTLRLFRVYPLHLAVLGLLVALETVKYLGQHELGAPFGQPAFSGRFPAADLVPNLLLVQSLHVLDHLSWNPPSWSISCEFAAYIVFAVAMASRVGRSRWFFTIAAMLAVLGYAWLAAARGGLDVTYDWGIVRCLAGFILGMIAYHLRPALVEHPARARLERADLGLLAFAVATMSLASGVALVLVIPLLLGVVALVQFDRGPLARLLMTRPIQFLGRVSYSVYMIQLVVLLAVSFVARHLLGVPIMADPGSGMPEFAVDPWTGDAILVAVVAVLLAAAAVSYRLIEVPARRFGRRLIDGDAFTRRGPAAAPPQALPR